MTYNFYSLKAKHRLFEEQVELMHDGEAYGYACMLAEDVWGVDVKYYPSDDPEMVDYAYCDM